MLFPLKVEIDYYKTPKITILIIIICTITYFLTKDLDSQWEKKNDDFCYDHPEMSLAIRSYARQELDYSLPNKYHFFWSCRNELSIIFAILSPEDTVSDDPDLSEEKKEKLLTYIEHYRDIVGTYWLRWLAFNPEIFNIISIFTSAFLHGGIIHLVINMYFLWLFARAVELSIGRLNFILLILLTSLFSSIGYTLITLFEIAEAKFSIGASGIVYGILGSFLYLLPKIKIKFLFFILFRIFWFTLPAWIMIILYFVQDFISFISSSYGNVNVFAHMSGMIFGFLYTAIFLKKYKYSKTVDNATKSTF